jgi:RimJ/RimL family protein N-acetyltransferase
MRRDSWITARRGIGRAFHHDVGEIFAVVRPGNTRAAATVHRNGMEWVGETGKYFGMNVQVFRLRRVDFDATAPTSLLPPNAD